MKKIEKKKQINEMKEGEFIDDIFVVKIKKSIRPYSKGFSFSLILSDSSGRSIEYKYWGDEDEEKIKSLFASIKPDSVIHISGKVDSYNGKLEINADKSNFLRILNPEEYSFDFIPSSKKDIEEMYSSLLEKINSISNQKLKNLVEGIIKDIGQKLKSHPGSIQIHHNWKGGLLQHVLEVIEYCETSIKLFPSLDRDILLTAAILHDIGKLEEIETTTRIKGTRKGQLIGHIIIGANYISKKLDEIDLDENTKNKILHLILSHQGKLEFGSPKQPMFPEAEVLYYADEFSSKISELISFIENNKELTEDDFMFHPKKGHNIFLR